MVAVGDQVRANLRTATNIRVLSEFVCGGEWFLIKLSVDDVGRVHVACVVVI